MEFERKKKIEEEKKRLKEFHFMKFPKCGMELLEIDYRSIKIDKCSECDGIWLDAGEMEPPVSKGSRAQKKPHSRDCWVLTT
ncbi:MAG: zf-TFIIB domain-containing protein [Pseudomonadota bacterium]